MSRNRFLCHSLAHAMGTWAWGPPYQGRMGPGPIGAEHLEYPSQGPMVSGSLKYPSQRPMGLGPLENPSQGTMGPGPRAVAPPNHTAARVPIMRRNHEGPLAVGPTLTWAHHPPSS